MNLRARQRLRRDRGGALWLFALALAALLSTRDARAHDFTPGVLALVETEPGGFDLSWTEPVDSGGVPAGVRIVFPSPCIRAGARLECGSAGLYGDIAFDGLHERRMQVIVSVRRLDGRAEELLVTGAAPRAALEPPRGSSARVWIGLGAAHGGARPDHLAFVAALLLLVGIDRRLAVALGAFVLSSAVALALGALDLWRLPRGPIEALVAATVLLVARESTHDAPTLTRRAPWAIALLCGLIHGLALGWSMRELGIPQGSAGRAVLWFGTGVTLVDLALVAGFVLAARLAGERLDRLGWPRSAATYAVGGIGAFWLIARAVAIVTSS